MSDPSLSELPFLQPAANSDVQVTRIFDSITLFRVYIKQQIQSTVAKVKVANNSDATSFTHFRHLDSVSPEVVEWATS